MSPTHLDSGQVTTWTSWHRWTAISLLACAFLAVAAIPAQTIPVTSRSSLQDAARLIRAILWAPTTAPAEAAGLTRKNGALRPGPDGRGHPHMSLNLCWLASGASRERPARRGTL